MAKLLELKLTKYHITFLLVPLFYLPIHYLQKKLNNNFKHNKNVWSDCSEAYDGDECERMHELAFFFIIFFPKLLAIFPYLIYEKWIKNNSDSKQVIRNINNNNKKRKIIQAILISILEIIYKTESFHKYEIVKNYIDIRIGNIFLLPILSFFIINKKVSIHQIISFIPSSFGVFYICYYLILRIFRRNK